MRPIDDYTQAVKNYVNKINYKVAINSGAGSRMGELTFCCWRLKDIYEEVGPEHEILVFTREFDETQWYINGLGHLYFCPFCGSCIAGEGFGSKVEPFTK